jgi:hypothetical protein
VFIAAKARPRNSNNNNNRYNNDNRNNNNVDNNKTDNNNKIKNNNRKPLLRNNKPPVMQVAYLSEKSRQAGRQTGAALTLEHKEHLNN